MLNPDAVFNVGGLCLVNFYTVVEEDSKLKWLRTSSCENVKLLCIWIRADMLELILKVIFPKKK